jgi:hypothetical protein
MEIIQPIKPLIQKKSVMLRIILFFLIPSLSFAQNLTGKWAGKITQDDGGYSYEYGISLEVKQTGNLVVGTSRVWLLEKPKVYAIMKLSGELKNGRFAYTESAITHQEDLGTYYWCFKAARLDLFVDARQMRLEGPWWGTGETPTCPPGKIYLSMATPEKDPVIVKPPVDPVIVDTLIVMDPNVISDVPPDDPIVVDNPPVDPPNDPVVVENNNNLNGRSVVVQGSAVVKQKEMTLYVWDTDEVDGDRVSLVFNGEKILSDLKLSKDRYAFTVTLIPGQENLLMLYAENLGKTPPNTAAISWWEAGQLKTKVLHSDMSKCGTLSFKSE